MHITKKCIIFVSQLKIKNMTNINNTYDLTGLSVDTQKNYFVYIISRSVYKNGDDYIFDKNLLSNDIEGKTLVNYKPIVEKVEKLVEMINNDSSLIEKDIETELWDMI